MHNSHSVDTQPHALRLFCLPPAGAGAGVFRPWIKQSQLISERFGLKPIEIVPVCLPGREARMAEPLIDSIADLADQLCLELAPQLDRPYAFFGYSMGGLLAYELTQRLSLQTQNKPQAIGVLASNAPGFTDTYWQSEPLHLLDQQAFRQRLRDFGGTAEEILDNQEIMDLFEPILRTDFKACETYLSQIQNPQALDVPIYAFAAKRDSLVKPSAVKAWQALTTKTFKLYGIDSEHMVSPHQLSSTLKQIMQLLS